MKWALLSSLGLNPLGNQWSAAERLKCRQALANDVELRCALTLRKVFNHYDNNLEKIKKNLPQVINYMMQCYRGLFCFRNLFNLAFHNLLGLITTFTIYTDTYHYARRSVPFWPLEVEISPLFPALPHGGRGPSGPLLQKGPISVLVGETIKIEWVFRYSPKTHGFKVLPTYQDVEFQHST